MLLVADSQMRCKAAHRVSLEESAAADFGSCEQLSGMARGGLRMLTGKQHDVHAAVVSHKMESCSKRDWTGERSG